MFKKVGLIIKIAENQIPYFFVVTLVVDKIYRNATNFTSDTDFSSNR